MDVLSYTDTRARLKEVMDRVSADKAPVVVTRRNGEAIVMVSLSEWQAMEETAHLLASPVNAQRLRASIAQLEAGEGTPRDIPDA